nr:phosphocarrier protein HPr [uncultured Bacillus sp.]
MVEKQFTVIDAAGLHARPSTILVQAAKQFNSDINLTYKGKKVNVKSILGIMSLGVGQGEEIQICAEGNDEQEAMNSLQTILNAERLAE